jgi:hypothetical protein
MCEGLATAARADGVAQYPYSVSIATAAGRIEEFSPDELATSALSLRTTSFGNKK